jgi:hypothetical protein
VNRIIAGILLLFAPMMMHAAEIKPIRFAMNQETPLNFSGDQLFKAVFLELTLPWKWSNETTTTAFIKFTPTEDFLDFYPTRKSDSAGRYVKTKGTLAVKTADGVIDKTWPAELGSNTLERIIVKVKFDPAELPPLTTLVDPYLESPFTHATLFVFFQTKEASSGLLGAGTLEYRNYDELGGGMAGRVGTWGDSYYSDRAEAWGWRFFD